MLTLNKIRRHREDDMSYIEHLIKKGADINKMYRGWNAVLQALDNGDMQILRLLATMGSPDLTARDEHGRSVYVLSSDFYFEAVTDLFSREEMMHERGLEEEISILLGGGIKSLRTKDALGQFREMTL